MPPRDLKSLLDQRDARDPELRLATMVQPNGTAERIVTLTGSDERIVVGAGAQGMTYAPGAQVMVAKPAGATRWTVIDGPPPGNAGGSSFGLRTLPAKPKPGHPYYAYYLDSTDGVVLAWLYRDGAYVSDRGILEYPDIQGFAGIVADPAHSVGDGSVLFWSGAPPTSPVVLHVWDPSAAGGAGVVSDHAADAGHLLSPAGWFAGWIYWFDAPESSPTGGSTDSVLTLYRARADFSSLSTVGTITIPVPGGLERVDWTLGELMLDAGGAETIATAADAVGHEVTFAFDIRIGLDGSDPQAVTPSLVAVAQQGIPASPSGGSFRLLAQGADVSIWRRDGAVGANYAQFWPTTAPWSLQAFIHCATSADLGTAFTYGVPDTSTGAFSLYSGPSGGSFGDAPKVIQVAKHPTVNDYPTYFLPGY